MNGVENAQSPQTGALCGPHCACSDTRHALLVTSSRQHWGLRCAPWRIPPLVIWTRVAGFVPWLLGGFSVLINCLKILHLEALFPVSNYLLICLSEKTSLVWKIPGSALKSSRLVFHKMNAFI